MTRIRVGLVFILLAGCGGGESATEAVVDAALDISIPDASSIPDAMPRPRCGDGRVQQNESCDDGNDTNDDGCDNNCTPSGCGNGVVNQGEGCDDGNLNDGDGCDSNCRPTACGNGIQTAMEACDDGNRDDGDGCDSNCTETGCGNGIQSSEEECDDGNEIEGDGCDTNCTPTSCGNGRITRGELCDDGNAENGDGCDNNCRPSGCGNGAVGPEELCDDGNDVNGDGCDTNCTPTACQNGIRTPPEQCDDGNDVDGDGCDTNCRPTGCGNGLTTDGELCDDGNLNEGDGCDSNCTPTGCQNGILTEGESCDDGNAVSGDGCDADCSPTGCGNGIVTGDELCDDGNLADGDGCDRNCTETACGNGIQTGIERCDDGNVMDGDGCDRNCTPTGCGNGVITGEEACDDGNELDADGCDTNCQPSGCGNGVRAGDEICDDGNLDPDDGCEPDCTPTPRCDDGLQNALETDIDCGGEVCAPCSGGFRCVAAADCASAICTGGFCQLPTCVDGLRNGREGDVDCGGWSGVADSIFAGGDDTCALLSGSTLKCMGDNSAGQLGLGDARSRGDTPNHLGDRLPPYPTGGEGAITSATVGRTHLCVVLDHGAIQCTGRHSSFAPDLAAVDDATGDAPDEVGREGTVFTAPEGRFVEVSAGGDFVCARTQLGRVLCWGGNEFGQLGLGEPTATVGFSDSRFIPLGGGRTAVQITTGEAFACARLDNGDAKCWGRNNRGQLGARVRDDIGLAPDSMGDSLDPIRFGEGRTAQMLLAGGELACALLDDRTIKCWGDNSQGQLGQGQGWITHGTGRNHMGDTLPAIEVSGERHWTGMSVGERHVCALNTTGQIYCWGLNEDGQLGQGDRISRGRTPDSLAEILPIQTHNGLAVVDVSAGAHHSCALLANRRVICWGDNSAGQLGTGDALDRGADRAGAVNLVSPIDFGANCALCAMDQACETPEQCASGICRDGTCREPGCNDGIRNGQESDVDCGGDECRGCSFGSSCRESADCLSLSCAADGLDLGRCRSATCQDGVKNGSETDIDCGGPNCAACADRMACDENADCSSNLCLEDVCVSCEDGILNGAEIDVDCGGPRCAACSDGQRCVEGANCSSGQCEDGVCISCEDGLLNGSENIVDCGGPLCPGCQDGTACDEPLDCDSRLCEDGRCISCSDGILNGTETDLDCGGQSCAGCAPRQTCVEPFDCASRVCQDNLCRPPTCFDGVENGTEGDADCGSLVAVVEKAVPGELHSCFLLAGNEVKCLGDNRQGQLGVGDLDPRTELETLSDALPTVSLPEGASDLFSGNNHSCALSESGQVYCWGDNAFGQLGIGSTDDVGGTDDDMGAQMRRTLLPNDISVVDMCLGVQHTCALDQTGQVRCWGANGRGQLGYADRVARGGNIGSMGGALLAIDLGEAARAVDVVCGKQHSCALLDSGHIKCWGDSRFGQLGLGVNFPVGDDPEEMGDALPVIDLGDQVRAAAIAAGENHTCAVTTNGRMKCWGSDVHSALGVTPPGHRGDAPDEMGDALPYVPTPEPSRVTQLVAGANVTCALLSTRELHCWGANLQWGTIGIGEAAASIGYRGAEHPAVDLGAPPLSIALVAQHACALMPNNSVRCWGRNDRGQLGLGDTRARGRAPGDMGDALAAAALGRGCPGCAVGAGCATAEQCASGVCVDNVCAGVGCGDGVRNGAETDADCGGPDCGPCAPSQRCQEDADCRDQQCLDGECSTCGDRTNNGRETGTDCGGSDCGACPLGEICVNHDDCASIACGDTPEGLRCVERSCEDGITNGLETDTDCGGADCPSCADGRQCRASEDCRSTRCEQAICASCSDGLRNGAEVDVDCGGPCDPCDAGSTCRVPDDCASGQCLGSICQVAHCGDGILNGDESDVDCGGRTPAVDVEAGWARTCIRFADGRLQCVGDNSSGALATGDDANRGDDVDEMGEALAFIGDAPLTVEDVQLGWGHTCALSEGSVICWGANAHGQLGRGDSLSRGADPELAADFFGPVDLGPDAVAIEITTGENHSCALLAGGQIKCWGANQHGQLGLGHDNAMGDDPNELGQALPAVPIPDSVAVSAGGEHTCALSEAGEVRCWGRGRFGQTGLGNRETVGAAPNEVEALAPVRIGDNLIAAQISAGQNHTCAATADGAALCWGANDRGQLGTDNVESVGDEILEMGINMRPVRFDSPIEIIEVGGGHSCALLSSGSVRCWGSNVDGQLGLGSDIAALGDEPGEMNALGRPVRLGDGASITSLSLGRDHTCVSGRSGLITCWGLNAEGQLGLGDMETRGRSPDDMGDNVRSMSLGAACPSCDVGQSCRDFGQCVSLECNGDGLCAFDGCADADCAHCWDGVLNGAETDVDCGGALCPSCVLGAVCSANSDCETDLCRDQLCVSCRDGLMNGRETDVDCGGSDCFECGLGLMCEENADCQSGLCQDGVCN